MNKCERQRETFTSELSSFGVHVGDRHLGTTFVRGYASCRVLCDHDSVVLSVEERLARFPAFSALSDEAGPGGDFKARWLLPPGLVSLIGRPVDDHADSTS
jgi:hypothetical protein